MYSLSALRRLCLASLLAPVASQAGVTIFWNLNGSQLTATVAGSFSAAELAAASDVTTATVGTNMAIFDTTPNFYNFLGQAQSRAYIYDIQDITQVSQMLNLNNYEGAAAGEDFAFITGGDFRVYVAGNYVAGSAINATATFSVSGVTNLDNVVKTGDVIKLNGSPFISFSTSAVPEPSTYGLMLGGLALGAVALRRRRKA